MPLTDLSHLSFQTHFLSVVCFSAHQYTLNFLLYINKLLSKSVASFNSASRHIVLYTLMHSKLINIINKNRHSWHRLKALGCQLHLNLTTNYGRAMECQTNLNFSYQLCINQWGNSQIMIICTNTNGGSYQYRVRQFMYWKCIGTD